jgi:hypothetical protein
MLGTEKESGKGRSLLSKNFLAVLTIMLALKYHAAGAASLQAGEPESSDQAALRSICGLRWGMSRTEVLQTLGISPGKEDLRRSPALGLLQEGHSVPWPPVETVTYLIPGLQANKKDLAYREWVKVFFLSISSHESRVSGFFAELGDYAPLFEQSPSGSYKHIFLDEKTLPQPVPQQRLPRAVTLDDGTSVPERFGSGKADYREFIQALAKLRWGDPWQKVLRDLGAPNFVMKRPHIVDKNVLSSWIYYLRWREIPGSPQPWLLNYVVAHFNGLGRVVGINALVIPMPIGKDDWANEPLFNCLPEDEFAKKLDEIQRKKQEGEKTTTFCPK